MTSFVGRDVAHYRIVQALGSGGMGDVYVAEDTKLNREVALKVLPAELADDEERRARFEREAKALAALNHPRIVTVYSVEEHDGVHFITMELVQGKNLSELLPVSRDRFFEIATAIADAVATAHEHGITHRDLKPDNVMVTDDGDVKVLDFGLAKVRAGFADDSDPESPTALKTREGGIVGTVHYMSPEQAEGKSLDHRTDIINESGTRAWSPTWARDGRTLLFTTGRSGNLDVWQQSLTANGTPAGDSSPVTGGLTARRLSLSRDGAKVAYSKGRLLGNLWRVPILEDRPAEWSDAEQLTFDEAEIETVDISPDGNRVLFDSDRDGNSDLWFLELDSSRLVQVTIDPADDFAGEWSPDGEAIAFYSLRRGSRDIFVHRLRGGPVEQLTQGLEEDTYPSWSPNGDSLIYTAIHGDFSELRWMRADGSSQRSLPTGNEFPIYARWSRHGTGIIFTNWIESHTVWFKPSLDAEPNRLTDKLAHYARWSRDGDRVFVTTTRDHGGNIWTVSPIDGSERVLTNLEGRLGQLSWSALATDGSYLYFVWQENLGDIWMMDVVY